MIKPSLDTLIEDVDLEVDNETCSLKEFIKTNAIEEPQCSCEELIAVLSLKVGETVHVGAVDVKRMIKSKPVKPN
jgi:hypothetical protein